MAKPALTGVDFQHQVSHLWQCTKGKPQDPFKAAVPPHQQLEHHELPLQAEVDLAEAVAYIAAVKKGVESVSASAISVPNDARHELLIYIASNDGIQEKTESSLRTMFSIIEQSVASAGSNRSRLHNQILEVVVTLNSGRIKARLKTRQGNRPAVLQGLQEMTKLVRQRVSQDRSFEVLVDRLAALCESIRAHNVISKSTTSVQHQKSLVLACFEFWKSRALHSTTDMLRRADVDIDESRGNPHLRQVAKIAAYEHVTRVLVTHALHRQYGSLFRHIILRFVPAHAPIPIVSGIADASCHNRYRVHAEVQLVMDIDVNERRRWQPPRALGSSKAACFLCDMFIRRHGVYFVPRGHGVLTKYWAVPDHDGFTRAQRQRYRQVVQAMTLELLELTTTKHPRRIDPAMSWQALSRLGQLRLSEQSSRVPTPSHSLSTGQLPFTRGSDLPQPLFLPTSRPSSVGVSQNSTDHDRAQNLREMSGELLQNVEVTSRTEFDLQAPPSHGGDAQLVTVMEQTTFRPEGTSLVSSGRLGCTPVVGGKIGVDPNAVTLLQPGSSDGEKRFEEDQEGGGCTICAVRGNQEVLIESATEPCHVSQYNGLTENSPSRVMESKSIDSIQSTSSARKVSEPDGSSCVPEAAWQVQSISDLDMRGHESRACNVSTIRDARGQQSQPRASRVVDTSRKIDFHDMELFFDFESSTTTDVCSEANAAPQSSNQRVIDIRTLQYGQDCVIDLSTADADQDLFLKSEQKDGTIKWLRLHWERRERSL
ncbi:hypothetical protein LTS08_001116 [Lithohypha guttulata]|nr:hypothetical protein LTS08_001116 [Lithohypha guttulata]